MHLLVHVPLLVLLLLDHLELLFAHHWHLLELLLGVVVNLQLLQVLPLTGLRELLELFLGHQVPNLGLLR